MINMSYPERKTGPELTVQEAGEHTGPNTELGTAVQNTHACGKSGGRFTKTEPNGIITVS